MSDPTSNPPAPADAQARIATLRNDPAFSARWASGDANARAELAQLHEVAYPGQTNLTHTDAAPSAPAAPTSAEQAQARIAALKKDPGFVERWANGDSAARAELARLHETAYAGTIDVAEDVRGGPADPTAEEIDHAHPAAQPHEYELPSLLEHPDDKYTPEIAAMDRTLRGVLAEARFTKPVGSTVAKEVGRALDLTRDMDEDAFKVHAANERAKLVGVWKGDFDRKLGMARKLVGELEERAPGITEFLQATGAGSSASVLTMLAHQAEILLARQGGK